MEEERINNFKELQAKFQNCDAPSLLRPTQFPAGTSQKNERSTQPTEVLTNGNLFSDNHKELSPSYSSGDSQTLKPQQILLTKMSEIPKDVNNPEPLGKCTVCSAGNSQKVSVLLDLEKLSAGLTDEKKAMVASSFRDKLRNWEKVSSQKSEMASSFPLSSCGSKAFYAARQKAMELTPKEPQIRMKTKGPHTLHSQKHLIAQTKTLADFGEPAFSLSQPGGKNQENPSSTRSLGNTTTCPSVYEYELASQAPEKQPNVRHHGLPPKKPLPSMESLGPPPPKPLKPPVVSLLVFQRQAASLSKIPTEVAVKEGSWPPESADFEEPHSYEGTISYLRHSSNSINLCTAEEIADETYEVTLEELQQPRKSFLHESCSLEHEYEDKNMKEKEPYKLEPPKSEKDLPSTHPLKVDASGKIQMIRVHEDRSSMLAGQQEAEAEVNHIRAFSQAPKLPAYSLGQGGYVHAVELATEPPEPGVFLTSPIAEDTYDDVECSRGERPKSGFSKSFSSDMEENNKIYEDIYKTNDNSSTIDLDGKETLKRLQHFFQKEKKRFKVKKVKTKENISAFSISLPNLEFRSQEVIIYDDVDVSEKETKDEDKHKTWKPQFFISKGKKGKNSAGESESFFPRNFFRIKKQNLEKNRIEREEKLFREKFEYDKEIIVINKARVCSSNSRNGVFDLPVTHGEELEVIDITEQNLVICRNSKGRCKFINSMVINFKSLF
ncbi:FYN-binding protein 2 [Ochotona princeps]|uniref:FYN-binding protein 2 n=1 Tax=Ochotona princeps TaxID=9978 RepID=UPI00271512C9|nr:FYN-binding protein 2 [Ochotona princeps]